jgi:UDP-GlcNAc3NAcA epimerase
MTRTILSVVGARPQFIKAAAVGNAFLRHPELAEILVHTGQHYDAVLSQVFFDALSLAPPSVNLGVRETTHARMTAAMLVGLEDVMTERKPDAVLLYGDTNSTLAGALAAAKLALPVFHVEAGVRSFRADQPEEINRTLTDHVSRLLFCPTRAAVENLRREGIAAGVLAVGDVMYDMARLAASSGRGVDILARIGLDPKAYRVATLHRAENTDDGTRLAALLLYLDARAGEMPLVVPLHPRTAQAIARFGLDPGRITIVEPVGYFEMAALVRNSVEVLTDSGGLQKEAYFHRVPCVTMRDETEWVETIDAGWNRLWTVPDYAPRHDIDDYGDGDAADRIVAAIAAYFEGPASS